MVREPNVPFTLGPASKSQSVLRISPIKDLNFDDSLDASKFNAVVGNEVLSGLNRHLQSIPGNVALSIDQLRKLGMGQLRCVFSPEVQRRIANGTAKYLVQKSGALQATAVDAANKGFVGNATLIGDTVSFASISVAATVIVVQACHFISAADISKRLTDANRKLDLLLEFREIDQISKLESIYYKVQELLADESVTVGSIEYRSRARRIHEELTGLRAVWRREALTFAGHVIKPPKKRWTNRLSGSVERADKANEGKLRAALSRLMLIEYTFRLEQAATLGDEEGLGLFSSMPLELEAAQEAVVVIAKGARLQSELLERLTWVGTAGTLYDQLTGFDLSNAPKAAIDHESFIPADYIEEGGASAMRSWLKICTPVTFDAKKELTAEQRIIPRHMIPYVADAKPLEQEPS